MPDSFYPTPDEPSDESPDESTDEQAGEGGDKGEDAEGETALLPASLFGGNVEVGHKCEVEVVGIHDGEVEIKYSKKPEEKSRQSEMEDAMDAGFARKPKVE